MQLYRKEGELEQYEDLIQKFNTNQIGEVKMQKARLQFGTYAQRQEGVQMQRIKLPGGYMNSDQLKQLADSADRYGSGFLHFTTRQAVQLYYLNLSEAPDLMRFLSEEGITTREACGNTVRNISTCYRSGTSESEPFFVQPYAHALARYLLRNNYNQTMGRKIKIAFEGCADDHSGVRFHDMGFWAVTRQENGQTKYGFQVYLGGGLGGTPMLGQLYTEFLPVEELLNFATAVLRIFDRYGERKKRMKARMKFLVKKLGWEKFAEYVDEERKLIEDIPLEDYYIEPESPLNDAGNGKQYYTNGYQSVNGEDREFQQWYKDSVLNHKIPGYNAVHVRLKLGDILAENARQLAEVARKYSAGELRVSIEQNLFLPWVKQQDIEPLFRALKEIDLAAAGAETVTDVATCPGSDTCRLGIASAKGLGSAITEAFEDGQLAPYRELANDLHIKISGCPNGCAQHASGNIGFHAAAVTKNNQNLPGHLLFLGGQKKGEDTSFGTVAGKYPAKNCIAVVERLLASYQKDRLEDETFNEFVERIGTEPIKELLADLREAPSQEEDPSFYKDFSHENEQFAVRKGVKGECAGTTISEHVPAIEDAQERLSQARAAVYHKEYEYAVNEAYEAAAAAARVPLYNNWVDPFTSEEAIWKFENLFVISGITEGNWREVSSTFADLKSNGKDETAAQKILDQAEAFVEYCKTEFPVESDTA